MILAAAIALVALPVAAVVAGLYGPAYLIVALPAGGAFVTSPPSSPGGAGAPRPGLPTRSPVPTSRRSSWRWWSKSSPVDERGSDGVGRRTITAAVPARASRDRGAGRFSRPCSRRSRRLRLAVAERLSHGRRERPRHRHADLHDVRHPRASCSSPSGRCSCLDHRHGTASGPSASASQTHGNLRIEIVWTVIPAIIVAVLFALTVHTTGKLIATPDPGRSSRSTGAPVVVGGPATPEPSFKTANEIHVPADRTGQRRPASRPTSSTASGCRRWAARSHDPRPRQPHHHPAGRRPAPTSASAPSSAASSTPRCASSSSSSRRRSSRPGSPTSISRRAQPGGAQAVAGAAGHRHAAVRQLPHHPRHDASTARSAPTSPTSAAAAAIAAFTLTNTPANLLRWIQDPQAVKPGAQDAARSRCRCRQSTQLVAYLEELK